MKLNSVKLGRQSDVFIANYVCAECGNGIDITDRFCRNCGHEISNREMPGIVKYDYGFLCGFVAHAILDGTIEKIKKGCSCRYEYPNGLGECYAEWSRKREEG